MDLQKYSGCETEFATKLINVYWYLYSSLSSVAEFHSIIDNGMNNIQIFCYNRHLTKYQGVPVGMLINGIITEDQPFRFFVERRLPPLLLRLTYRFSVMGWRFKVDQTFDDPYVRIIMTKIDPSESGFYCNKLETRYKYLTVTTRQNLTKKRKREEKPITKNEPVEKKPVVKKETIAKIEPVEKKSNDMVKSNKVVIPKDAETLAYKYAEEFLNRFAMD